MPDIREVVATEPKALNNGKSLPELEIRQIEEKDAHLVKEFCLNNLMQRTRLSNQYVYSSPIWLGVFLSAIAWATDHVDPWHTSDWGKWAFLCCSISATCLVGVDYFTYQFYEADTKTTLDESSFLKAPYEFIRAKKGKCWLAFYNNGLVGTIVLEQSSTKSSSAELTNWYVRARYREKGLGGDLLEQAISDARANKCTSLTIQTRSINKRANKSLEKAGFKKVARKPEDNVYWRMLRMKRFTWSLNPQTSTST